MMVENANEHQERYVLRIYNANRAVEAQELATRLEETVHACCGGECRVEFVDVLTDPERAIQEDVFATPMLVKELPEPYKRVLGDLKDPRRILLLLGLLTKEQ